MPINIARFIDRETAEFTVEVLTPMFLGGANGDAELRAAPLKNAIRYWWRITQGELSHEKMLEKEQKLFGGVTGEATRSLVDVVVTGSVRTGEVGDVDAAIGRKRNPEANGRNVPLSAYLGLGPINFVDGNYKKIRILPGEKFTLSVYYPKNKKGNIIDALSLFAEFGSLGARSRNGWGSFNLLAEDSNILLSGQKLLEKYGEEISSIFNIDKKYPFKLGKSNEEPLLWRLGMDNTWKGAMKLAGESYMDLRQKVLPFPKATPKGVQKRHILGYPITNHKIDSWGWNNGRMPSQLRIIIRQTGKQYNSYFFHLPHKIPKPWDSSLGSELSVWQKIHNYLDENFERTT